MIIIFNQLIKSRILAIAILVITCSLFNNLSAQATVSLTVTGGNSTTTCNDVFSGPDPKWAVNVEFEGWESYLGNPFCFNELPTTQFSQQITCLPDLHEVDVCFRAFENDGLFCNTDESCLTEICERFLVPYSGSIDYTLTLPDDEPSGGFVNFTIETNGTLTDQGNDNMCGAIDLGELNSGQQLGDATQDVYNNYCADGDDEPSTSADGAGWGNDFSVWFTFTTSSDPGSITSILGLSDPLNSGEFLNLQMALYQSSTTDCNGDFELVTASWNNTDLDELMVINCLAPNRTYYILVDGLIPPPTTRFHGLFGLQVNDEGIAEAPDQICDATALGAVPDGGEVSTGLTVSNLCATGEVSDPQNSIFPANNSVWFNFQAPASRHVLISAISDESLANGGLDEVDIQLAVFASADGTCNGNFTEVGASYNSANLDETLELSCLTPGETYYLLLNGGPNDLGGVFSVTVADAGYDPIIEMIDQTICFGDSLLVGNTYLTTSGPISISMITDAGCDSLIEGTLTILPQKSVMIDTVICAGTDIEIAGNLYNATGIYTDVIPAFDGCDSTILTTLEVLPILSLTVSQTVEATGFQTPDGAAMATMSGGIAPYTYLWENGETNATALNLTGGTNYCVTITDAIGCTAENCVLILFPSNIQTQIENEVLNCFGEVNGTLNLSIFNGVIPYEFTWVNPATGLNGNGMVDVEGGNATVENLPPGSYNFFITDAFGSTITTAMVIEPQPIITTLDETICFGDSLLVGNNFYKNSGPISENLISFTGCDSTINGTLNVRPFVTESVIETLCFGDSLQVGNVFYKNSGPILEVLTDQNGCDSVVTGNITILPEILATINPSICFGETFEIGNSSFQNSGTFIEVLTAHNGCDSIVRINLTVLGNLAVTANQDNEASGLGQADGTASALVIGGSGNFNYQWSNGSINPTITDLIGGQTYCVTVTDLDANCTSEDCVVVLFPVNILTNITNDFLDCFGANNGRLSFIVSNGQAPYNYTWIGDNGTSGNGVVTTEGGEGIIENLLAGNYEIVVSDVWGETSLMGTVGQPELLRITEVNNLAVSCFGNCDGSMEIEIEGGSGPYIFSWPDGQTTAAVSGLCSGTFQVTVTDQNNCVGTNSFTIVEPMDFQAQVVVNQSINCFGGSNGQAVVTTNGTPIFYEWDNGETTEEALNLEVGLHQVIVTNSDGCTAIAEVFVDGPQTPIDVEIITIQSISCSDATDGIIGVEVTAAMGELTYEWSTGNSDAQLENIGTGFYEITITDANGCTGIGVAELTAADPIIPEFLVQDVTCLTGDNSGAILVDTIIGGSPPFLFSLDPGQGFSTNQNFGFLAAGSYELFIEELSGCRTAFPFVVNAPEELVVTIGDDETIELGEKIDIKAISNSDNLIFEWELLDTTICVSCDAFTDAPQFTRLYQVRAIDTLTNCEAFDEKLVTVEKLRSVYIPNTFSPNGDGLNDLFTVAIGRDVERVISLKIFNRWGAQIYGRENIGPNELAGWNGTYGGENAENGVYVFISEVLFKDGFTQVYRGDLTLMR